MVEISKIITNNASHIWDGVWNNDERVYIKTPDARSTLARGIKHFVGDKAVWLPEYEYVAEWLSDNKGMGLLCAGDCGRGKSVICQKVIPVIFQYWHKKIMNTCTAIELNSMFDEYQSYKILSIDDVGTEPIANRYGEKRNILQEVVDLAERKQKLLVISTNMNEQQMRERYDIRTMDRLRALTKPVIFTGGSLRGRKL